MAPRHIWKACLLTALVLIAPSVLADDSSNAQDGNQSSSDADNGPCSFVWIGLDSPYVEPHLECLPKIIP